MGQICCGHADRNKPNKQHLKAAPTTLSAQNPPSSEQEKKDAMRKFVDVMDKKAQIIMKDHPDEVMGYLMNPAELLKKAREASRFEATEKLELAFAAYDTHPTDGKLSVNESKTFISAYFEAEEGRIRNIYRAGLQLVEGEVKGNQAEMVNKAVDTFRSKKPELIQMWHEKCDKNRDGQLQLYEVKQAFLGDEAGDHELKLADFLAQEFDAVLGFKGGEAAV
ncbi:hypothetical protein DIPPA_11892 [Diplonema papillatum]|nr:hypothetical protein DIPPA_11892 [Diplonema papillatum]